MRKFIALLCLCLLLLGCSDPARYTSLSVPMTTESIARGRTLFIGLGHCGFCHGEKGTPDSPPSGGRIFSDVYGDVAAPNLTPSETGLKRWTARDIMKVFREGTARKGRTLSNQVHVGAEWISDSDLIALVSYLRALPPVEKEVAARSLGFVERNTTGFFEGTKEVEGYVPTVNPKHAAEYGRYLTDHVARCGSCHSSPASLITSADYLAGGRIIKNDQGEKTAPGITNSETVGIGGWSESQIINYLKTGARPDNTKVDSNFCPVSFFKNAPDSDLQAIARYLKSDTEGR